MSPAPQKLVLVTGANGFVGSATTLEFLRQGWRVRGTVRSQDKADAWEAKYPQHKENLEWAIVKDLADDGAFDEAIKGVDAVAHTASPFNFAFRDNVKDMLEPALKGTTSVLKAAKNEPSVKAVTITLAAAQDLSKGADVGYTRTSKDWSPFTWDEAATTTNPVIVYLASKTFAERAAWEFLEKEKPKFSLSTVVPPIILGPALQPIRTLADLNLSAGAVWSIVDAEVIPPTAVPVFINVLNVAQAHYEAVVRPEAAGQRYLLIGGNNDNTVIARILREEFPTQAHRIPSFGEGPGEHWGYDSSPAEKDLGIKYISLRDTIRAAGEQLFAAEADTGSS